MAPGCGCVDGRWKGDGSGRAAANRGLERSADAARRGDFVGRLAGENREAAPGEKREVTASRVGQRVPLLASATRDGGVGIGAEPARSISGASGSTGQTTAAGALRVLLMTGLVGGCGPQPTSSPGTAAGFTSSTGVSRLPTSGEGLGLFMLDIGVISMPASGGVCETASARMRLRGVERGVPRPSIEPSAKIRI